MRLIVLTKMKRILVTGGSGFIGSNLVDFLVLQGHSVVVIDDLSTGIESNHNKSATYLKLDLCRFVNQPDELVELLKKHEISTVFHLAASADVFLSINNPEKVYKINVLSSIALVRACEKAEIKKFVFSSTSAVYGEPKYLPVDEDHVTHPISPYGLSKLSFEQYLDYFSMDSEMSITVFRLPNVYGLRQRPDLEGGVVAIFYDLMKQGKPVTIYGDGEQTRDWVYVDDIVDAFFKAIDYKEKFQIFLLGSNTKTSLNNLFESLKGMTNYKGTPKYTDERAGDIKNMVMSFTQASIFLNWKPNVVLSEGLHKLIKEA